MTRRWSETELERAEAEVGLREGPVRPLPDTGMSTNTGRMPWWGRLGVLFAAAFFVGGIMVGMAESPPESWHFAEPTAYIGVALMVPCSIVLVVGVLLGIGWFARWVVTGR